MNWMPRVDEAVPGQQPNAPLQLAEGTGVELADARDYAAHRPEPKIRAVHGLGGPAKRDAARLGRGGVEAERAQLAGRQRLESGRSDGEEIERLAVRHQRAALVGGSSRLLQRYHDAIVEYGRHFAPIFRTRSGVGIARSL